MKNRFAVLVLTFGLFAGLSANYAFSQTTDKTPDKTDQHKMGPGKMGANDMGGGAVVPTKTNKKKQPAHKHKKTADGKMAGHDMSGGKMPNDK